MSSIINALKSIKRNFSMSSASILLVFLTLIVLGTVFVLGLNVNRLSEDVLDSVTLYVYLDKDITDEEVDTLTQEIVSIDEVDGVDYSDKDEQLTEVIANIDGDNTDEIYSNFEGEDNPLSPVMIVSVSNNVTDLKPIADQINELENVDQINETNYESLKVLVNLISIIQTIAIIFAVILILISIFIITNTIRLAIAARRKEIEIMRLVGATKMYIRMPFVFEGAIIGFIASLFATALIIFGYNELLNLDLLSAYVTKLVDVDTINKYIIVAIPAFGVIIGMLGSLNAVRKHLRR